MASEFGSQSKEFGERSHSSDSLSEGPGTPPQALWNSSALWSETPFENAFFDLNSSWFLGGTAESPRTWKSSAPDHLSPSSTEIQTTAPPISGWIPSVPTSSMGSSDFVRDHHLAHAYVGGSMANGIASVDLVEALSRDGSLGFYGAAGQTPDKVAQALSELQSRCPDKPWGCNLIHSPSEPTIENEVSRLISTREIRHVEASAYLDISEPLIRLRLQGLEKGPGGEVRAKTSIMAKASRLEVARKFLSPAPEPIVRKLLASGEITAEQSQWAKEWPLCDDLTAEADSGGHTDNRPLTTLVPAFCKLRDTLAGNLHRTAKVRIGAAGGLGTPDAIAAAFALGAGYVVVGSVHQACSESGSSPKVRDLLATAGPADVIMAPASDMFEMGVHLQVLRRGTMFGPRARRLLELYRAYDAIDEIPTNDRQRIENEIFRMPLEEVWSHTRNFFLEREPSQIERAEQDSHHRMALIFRWYLGKSSDWANSGDPQRALDYQIWCGPAMGAFNEWTRGTTLEFPAGRGVARVSRALMAGAALCLRAHDLQRQGFQIPVNGWRMPQIQSSGNSDHQIQHLRSTL